MNYQTANPALDLVEYVETEILPRYAQFDRAHNLNHVTRVIRQALELARVTGADVNMVYVVAAYHDLGMAGPRAVHHITGGRMLAADMQLRRWFSNEQLKLMREAVEDHRASASHAPRSIYGRIVAEADRDLEPAVVFRRTVQFGLSHYPMLDREAQWQRFREHMQAKYSATGYLHLWIAGSANERHLQQLRAIIADNGRLRAAFDKYYDEER